MPYFLFILTSTFRALPLYHFLYIRRGSSSLSHPISKIGWVFILHLFYITSSVFFYSYLYFQSYFFIVLYYTTIFSFTCRCKNTLRGFVYILSILLSTFTVFLHFTFFLSHHIFTYYLILISILPVGVLHTYGVGFTSYSLSISSRCLPLYSFYTIPDLSVLPLWHTSSSCLRVFHTTGFSIHLLY